MRPEPSPAGRAWRERGRRASTPAAPGWAPPRPNGYQACVTSSPTHGWCHSRGGAPSRVPRFGRRISNKHLGFKYLGSNSAGNGCELFGILHKCQTKLSLHLARNTFALFADLSRQQPSFVGGELVLLCRARGSFPHNELAPSTPGVVTAEWARSAEETSRTMATMPSVSSRTRRWRTTKKAVPRRRTTMRTTPMRRTPMRTTKRTPPTTMTPTTVKSWS